MTIFYLFSIGDYVDSLIKLKKKTIQLILTNLVLIDSIKINLLKKKIKPSKQELLCLAIALKLNIEETRDLLQKAGYTLAEENSVFDNIIGYFIKNQIYDSILIDEYLVAFDQPTIFSVA